MLVVYWGVLGWFFFLCGCVMGLKSWLGLMFEMLMFLLVLDEFIGSVLVEVVCVVVLE